MTDVLNRRGRQQAAASLPARIDTLARIVELTEGRIDPAITEQGADLVARVRARLSLSPEHTIVALAGSTGSGKSSLFNAITGLDVAKVGVRRPTTSAALACVWGGDGADRLLDWLGVDVRRRVMRSSILENADDSEFSGLVLLDLPDHDSTEVTHRLEVARLVDLVDVIIWVVDPQKYADAAIHETFLRPLGGHADAVVVVLNQVDRLRRQEVDACKDDLGRLLSAEGLAEVPLLTTSVATMKGITRLRALIAERVLRHRAYVPRLGADLDRIVARLVAECGRGAKPQVDATTERRLIDALSVSIGLEDFVAAVERAYVARGVALVGWPPLRMASRLGRDPSRRLGVRGPDSTSAVEGPRSTPAPPPVQRAQVDAAARSFADSVVAPLPTEWGRVAHAALRRNSVAIPDALDQAVGSVELAEGPRPTLWRAIAVAHWVLLVAAVAGAGWLVAVAVDVVPGGWPLPTVLLALGLGLGPALVALGRRSVEPAARIAADRSRKQVTSALAGVARLHLVRPVEDEFDRLGEVRRLFDDVTRAH